jgi:hypothetical protein
MKAFLERVDPGACDFRKCDTEWTSGEAGPEYWLCSVTRLLFGGDVIDLEKSKKMTVVIKPDGFPSYQVTGGYPFIHLKAEAVGSAHLGQAIFCDQTLKDAYKEAGIKGGDFPKIGVDHW